MCKPANGVNQNSIYESFINEKRIELKRSGTAIVFFDYQVIALQDIFKGKLKVEPAFNYYRLTLGGNHE